MLTVSLTQDDLRPLVASVVAETIAAIKADEAKLGDRLAFSEPEAARLIGLEPHQLRDERGRGRIGASQIVGRRIRYTRSDLLQYLARNRSEPRI
ncbi:helix-turn-helix domain-containing protein [Schlesneria sp. DSM 10557]|uniref:helix-turn-helix domain-containing protein n=1 Tax=Schlesneria sp. DSM 10557 TaxID=3044399 RepID=UPI0035A07C63